MVVESNMSVSEVAQALGLPSGFDLDFNPFDENADQSMAQAVEKTSQMVMSTLNLYIGFRRRSWFDAGEKALKLRCQLLLMLLKLK